MNVDGSPPKILIATGNPGKMREYAALLRNAPFELVPLADLGITHEVDETGDTFEENARLKASEYGSLSGMLTLADDSGLEVDALGGEPGVLSARYGAKSPLTPLYEMGGSAATRYEIDGNAASRYERRGGAVPPSGPVAPLNPPVSDQDRVNLLLRNLEGVPWQRRTARFRCVLAIWDPRSLHELQDDSSSHISGEDSKSPLFVKGGWGDLAPPITSEGRLTLLVGSVAGMIQYEPMGEEGFGYDPVFYLPSYGLTMAQLPLEEKNLVSHRANASGKAVKFLNTIG